jgi:hypothetical protein
LFVSPDFHFSIFVDAFEQTARPFVKRMKIAQASSSSLRSRADCMIGSKFDRAHRRCKRCTGAVHTPTAAELGLKLKRRWAETGPDEFLKFSQAGGW